MAAFQKLICWLHGKFPVDMHNKYLESRKISRKQ